MAFLYLHPKVRLGDIPSLEKVFQQQIQAQSVTQILPDAAPGYEKLPTQYDGMDRWPKSCNLKCWSCGRFFMGVPRFVPLSVSQVSGRLVCTREGVECSFVCANQRIHETTQHNPQMGYRLRENLKALYRDMEKKEPPAIWAPSVSRFESVEYGGSMDEKKMADTIAQLEVTPENTIQPNHEEPKEGESCWNHG